MSKKNKYYSRIFELRKIMLRKKIESFLVTHDDEHLLENTHKNFERLNWITGFTGSAGYLLVTINNLYLFVDGRYLIQAKTQTLGLSITILDVAETNLLKFILSSNHKIQNLAIDVKAISYSVYVDYFNASKKVNIKIINLKKNLIDYIWKRNLTIQNTDKIFVLDKKFCGKSPSAKIKSIFKFLETKKADSIFIQNSESAAWLFNLRGADLPYTPITFCYVLISKKIIFIFLEKPELSKKILNLFPKNVNFLSFSHIPETLKRLKTKNNIILIDPRTTNKYYHDLLKRNFKTLSFCSDPISNLKAIKNEIEIKNSFKAHIIDGVAVTKFIYWFKNFKTNLTELDIVNKIDNLRKTNNYFLCKSFPTIANRKLSKQDILLLDSGAQYKLGTTDVTRTLSRGKPKDIFAQNYTLVLKGHIKLNNAIFPNGTSGAYLDYLARSELWKYGKDYTHGTGHGVGFCLNVHEGPFSISKNNQLQLEEGMVFSNEPGYYYENKFGIRIENLVTIRKKILNKKKFFSIETLTLAPYDMDLIKKNLLSNEELFWISNYQKKVFKKLSPYLLPKEKDWLYKEIKKL